MERYGETKKRALDGQDNVKKGKWKKEEEVWRYIWVAKRKVCNGEESEGRGGKGKQRREAARRADCTFATAAGHTSAEQCTTTISNAATTATATTAKPTVCHNATTNGGNNAAITNINVGKSF